jgi:hypothetical protein
VSSRLLAQTVDASLWGADGNVLATARSGNTLYIGGSFSTVGPNSGGGVPVNQRDGEPLRPYPRIAGTVYAALPDGAGGWYVGGQFEGVGDQPRSNLAHIFADGSVAAWDPSTDGAVCALARDDHTIYVGGTFSQIGGVARARLAAVDARTGRVTSWNPNVLGVLFFGGAEVRTLDVAGHTVYVGGLFTVIGGKQRNGLAAVDTRSGLATDWAPDAELGYWVDVLKVSGDVVYVGGPFRSLGGQPREMIAAVDIRTGLATSFDAQASGTQANPYSLLPGVRTLAVQGGTLYVGGLFDHMGGQPRECVAALDTRTGNATEWNPQLADVSIVYSLVPHRGLVYVGGGFSGVDGRSQPVVTAIDMRTARATEWNPRPNSYVTMLAADRRSVFVAGPFTSIWDWVARRHLAALDLSTGTVTPWNPNPDGSLVYALLVSGETVFAGGSFSNIGGQPRTGIAALDGTTGAATDWNAHSSGPIEALALSGRTLYVGGGIGTIGGKTRPGAAALDIETAQATDWDPQTDGPVFALLAGDSLVYLGGYFTRVGVQRRVCLAAVTASTGAVTPWNPGVTSFVNALARVSGTIYIGGGFQEIGGVSRSSLAAVDALTGEVLPWDPNLSPGHVNVPYVKALSVVGNTLYVGGDFSAIAGQSRRNLAAVDVLTDSLLPWDPEPDGLVWCLAGHDDAVFAGGGFERVRSQSCSGIARITPATGPRDPRWPGYPGRHHTMAGLELVVPSPAPGTSRIRFSLPAAAPVKLALFDLQGRRVMDLLVGEWQAAGEHEVGLRATELPRGVYFCRLEAGETVVTRKLVLVR